MAQRLWAEWAGLTSHSPTWTSSMWTMFYCQAGAITISLVLSSFILCLFSPIHERYSIHMCQSCLLLSRLLDVSGRILCMSVSHQHTCKLRRCLTAMPWSGLVYTLNLKDWAFGMAKCRERKTCVFLYIPSMATNWEQPDKYDWNHSNAVPVTPILDWIWEIIDVLYMLWRTDILI